MLVDLIKQDAVRVLYLGLTGGERTKGAGTGITDVRNMLLRHQSMIGVF